MGQTDKNADEDPTKWRYRSSAARVVVVFTDAPFKPKMAIPEAAGGTVDDVINKLMEQRIILSIFAPEDPGYQTLAETPKSEYAPLVDEAGNRVDIDKYTADQAKFQNTLKQLAMSVSKSAETEVLPE